jgi:hypothetical protein
LGGLNRADIDSNRCHKQGNRDEGQQVLREIGHDVFSYVLLIFVICSIFVLSSSQKFDMVNEA